MPESDFRFRRSDLRELALDPHLRSRGFLEKVRHPLIGNRLWTRAVPGHIEGFDLSIPRASPMLGEHNEEVLGGLLGLSEEELSELARDRIIGRRPVAPAATEAIDLDRLGAYPGLREYDPDYRQRLALDDN